MLRATKSGTSLTIGPIKFNLVFFEWKKFLHDQMIFNSRMKCFFNLQGQYPSGSPNLHEFVQKESWFDTINSFKNSEIFWTKSFEVNWPQPVRGSSFKLRWRRGIFYVNFQGYLVLLLDWLMPHITKVHLGWHATSVGKTRWIQMARIKQFLLWILDSTWVLL